MQVKGTRMKDFFEKIRINEEKDLLTYMQQAFNTSAINALLKIKTKQEKYSLLPIYMRGDHLHLSQQIGGRLHTVSQEILNLFEFTERPVKFCISNDPEVNAFAHFNHNEDEPHFIVLNSGLVDKMTEDELKFTIGHEFGHLIYAHSVFINVMNLIYPEGTPPFVNNIYSLWRSLSEISADRVGLLAVTDFEPALSAMFKITCGGLDMMRFQINASNYMAMTDSIISDIMTSPHNFSGETYPTNSVRIKALDVFYHSKLRQSFLTKRLYAKDNKLTKKTDELISILQKRPIDKDEYAKLNFLAAAGCYLIKSDEDIVAEEYDELINILSNYHYWPPAYVDSLPKDTDPMEIIDKAAAYIVKNTPQDIHPLFKQLVPLITKDRRIDDKEIDALLIIAEKLKLPKAEAVDEILSAISNLNPWA